MLANPATAMRRPGPMSLRIPAAAATSGVSVTLRYLVGPVPLYLATARVFATPAQLTSGFFVAFLTAGVVTIALSVRSRQPQPHGWTRPRVVYIATMASQYSFATRRANCSNGLALVFLRSPGSPNAWPGPPRPGRARVFAGIRSTSEGGCTPASRPSPSRRRLVSGFFAARKRRTGSPSVGPRLRPGLLVMAASGGFHPTSFQAGLPAVEFVRPVFDFSAIVAVGLPLLLLAVGLQNMQGFGGLRAAGYEPPFRLVTAVLGGVSMVHASVGAPPGGMQTTPLFVMAGDQSGPKESRWIAAVVASVGCLAIAAGAVTVAAFVSALPLGFVAATVGIILLATVFDSLRSALSGPMAFPAFVAFVVAASDLSIAGMGAPLWALVIGAVATAKMPSLQQPPVNVPAPAAATAFR